MFPQQPNMLLRSRPVLLERLASVHQLTLPFECLRLCFIPLDCLRRPQCLVQHIHHKLPIIPTPHLDWLGVAELDDFGAGRQLKFLSWRGLKFTMETLGQPIALLFHCCHARRGSFCELTETVFFDHLTELARELRLGAAKRKNSVQVKELALTNALGNLNDLSRSPLLLLSKDPYYLVFRVHFIIKIGVQNRSNI